MQANGSLSSSPIVTQPEWSYPDAFFNNPLQRSAPMDLQAGQAVLLEAAHCNHASGPGYMQVGRCRMLHFLVYWQEGADVVPEFIQTCG
jgi:hypothetical protein